MFSSGGFDLRGLLSRQPQPAEHRASLAKLLETVRSDLMVLSVDN